MQIKLKPWFALPTSAHPVHNIVIVGGGLAGLGCAYALAKRGQSVTIVEQAADIAAGASQNHAGLLMPLLSGKQSLEAQFYQTGFSLTRDCIQTLKMTGFEVTAALNGLLYFGANARISQDLASAVSAAEASVLAGVEIAEHGLYLKTAGYVALPSFCAALKAACGKYLTVVSNTAVIDIRRQNALWQLQTNQDICYQASTVIVANAERLGQFTVTESLPIRTVPGQLHYIEANNNTQALRLPLCGESYLLPTIEGVHVLGASFRQDPTDTAILAADYEMNLMQLAKLSPALAKTLQNQPWQGRIALRATTIDHLPMVGPVADYQQFNAAYARMRHGDQRYPYPQAEYLPGLYVSTAHGSRGLSGTILAGEMLASLICQTPLPVSEEIYQALHPSRFWLRELKRGPHSPSFPDQVEDRLWG